MVYLSHINLARHVGNDSLISFINEARYRYILSKGYDGIKENPTIIVADIAVIYKSEVQHGDTLIIEATPGETNTYGFDLFFRITNKRSHEAVVHAKEGLVFFDYDEKKVVPIPEKLKSLLI